MIYYVYSTSHPNDVASTFSMYGAYCLASDLVELGFEPVIRREGYGRETVFDWDDITKLVSGWDLPALGGSNV